MRTKALGRCLQCSAKLHGEALCPACGYPTSRATSEVRIEWEISQWRAAHTPPNAGDDPRIVSPIAHEPSRPNKTAGRRPQPVAIEIDLSVTEPAVVFRARAGRRPATLGLGQATVFMEPSGPGRRRWLPLDEVTAVRASTHSLVIEGVVERIRVTHREPTAIARMHRLVMEAVEEARQGMRHDPDVLQAWCELSSDLWKSRFGRLRTRARKIGPLL